MNVFIISYDLGTKDASRYDQLIGKIKSYQNNICLGESSYLIETDETSLGVRDALRDFLVDGDKLYVGRVTSPAAWYGLSDLTSKWIKDHL